MRQCRVHLCNKTRLQESWDRTKSWLLTSAISQPSSRGALRLEHQYFTLLPLFSQGQHKASKWYPGDEVIHYTSDVRGRCYHCPVELVERADSAELEMYELPWHGYGWCFLSMTSCISFPPAQIVHFWGQSLRRNTVISSTIFSAKMLILT